MFAKGNASCSISTNNQLTSSEKVYEDGEERAAPRQGRGQERGVGGRVVALAITTLALDDYNVCARCGPTARIPSGLCKRRITITSAISGVNGLD